VHIEHIKVHNQKKSENTEAKEIETSVDLYHKTGNPTIRVKWLKNRGT